ncbi:MAG TPA: rRNA maturation RNase YbeY [Myxococcaceae bacterium]|jgi:probable rRNA maturation factor
MRIRHGKLIPRDDGKRIEEVVGRATTGTDSMSVAKMLAPPGWGEPPQRPRFDEVVVVLRGELTLVIDGKVERIAAGEVGLCPRGRKVVYRNDAGAACEYVSVCAPAFTPARARMEPAKAVSRPSRIDLDLAHPRARALSAAVRRRAEAFLRALELRGCELSVSLVGDRAIRRLNRAWRRKDEATDVLSFPAGDAPRGAPGPRPLGDVIISLDTAARRAREDARPLEAEVARYLAHGLLHLLGHDHRRPADARRMAAEERRLLRGRGMLPAP